MNNNTSVGASSLRDSRGDDNTAVGANALKANWSGTKNTAVGKDAGDTLTTGGENTILGSSADVDANSRARCVVLGFSATSPAVDGSLAIGGAGGNAMSGLITSASPMDYLRLWLNGTEYKTPIQLASATGLGTSLLPISVPPIARFGTGTAGRISNGLSVGSAINVPSQTMSVFPIYIPKAITLASAPHAPHPFQLRTSGSSTAWPGTQAARTFTFRLYAHGSDNLPSTAISDNNTLAVPANITTNTNFTFGPSNQTLPAGWIWFGFAAHSDAIELAGISTAPASLEAMMFGKFTGTGSSQTSNFYSFATAIASATPWMLPDTLAGRAVDLAATTASQTTLRTRTGAPMLWCLY